MSDTLALLGYVPESYLFQQQMQSLLHTFRVLYVGLIVFVWLLPLRIGWQGVWLAMWVTFWFAYSLALPWFVKKMKELM